MARERSGEVSAGEVRASGEGISESGYACIGPLNRTGRTSKVQHPTSNIQPLPLGQSLDVGRSMLVVGCCQDGWNGKRSAEGPSSTPLAEVGENAAGRWARRCAGRIGYNSPPGPTSTPFWLVSIPGQLSPLGGRFGSTPSEPIVKPITSLARHPVNNFL